MIWVCACYGSAFAQATATKPEATGTVSGHATCSDTNQPARMARVILKPVDYRDNSVKDDFSPASVRANAVPVVQTDLDGNFGMTKVKPGQYFVFVDKQGYLSPVAGFDWRDLKTPTPEIRKRMLIEVPTVTVTAGVDSRVEVRLRRGAAISGRVLFDDGTPAAGVTLDLKAKDANGAWQDEMPVSYGFGYDNVTDDRGQFRLAGLTGGEYLVAVFLTTMKGVITGFVGDQSADYRDRYDLVAYSGGVFREKDAVPVKVAAGEERTGADVEIPLTKLHRVSGMVVHGPQGQIVNAATVSMRYEDDNDPIATVEVGKVDDSFHFEFVPEGEYVLEVKDARDVTREEVSDPRAFLIPTQTKETVVHRYGDGSTMLIVKGETSDVLVAVPERQEPTEKTPPVEKEIR
jgi:hypothetical protein